jgi:4-hydroxybenzoate polyprenyltransferase
MEVQAVQPFILTFKDNLLQNLNVFARDIKLSHSIFAMPFVGVALSLTGVDGVSGLQLCKVIFCMILARSFAMGMNRYLDRDIDAANQRTRVRALPAGDASPRIYLTITMFFGLGFIAASFTLSDLAGWLSPLLLAVLAFYSLMKKISWLTHWYLGVCLGLAPIAAEIALFNRVSMDVVLVGLAVTFWTAGFDLLYSLQDQEFDRAQGLYSAPSKLGHKAAIRLSRLSFLFMIFALISAGILSIAGMWWYIGVILVGGILIAEHWVIRDAMHTGHSNKINVAFFNLNAAVSVIFFIFSLVDAYAKS